MAITLADAFLTSVQSTLLDPNGVYWTPTELIGYYNIFVTLAIGEKPDALTKTVSFPLAAGIEQVLPADGVTFLRAAAVAGATLTQRSAITQVTAEAMNDADPTWYARPGAPYTAHIIADQNDPLRFRVWPPSDGTGSLMLTYSYAPPDAALPTDPFTLTEAYRDPARSAVLAMAYAKNTDRGDMQKSAFYLQQLEARLSQRLKSTLMFLPRTASAKTTE